LKATTGAEKQTQLQIELFALWILLGIFGSSMVRTSGPGPAWAAELYRQEGKQQSMEIRCRTEVDCDDQREEAELSTQRAFGTLDTPLNFGN
jgi:hypothetical protein